jgi:hypothetical protein
MTWSLMNNELERMLKEAVVAVPWRDWEKQRKFVCIADNRAEI